MLYKIKIAMVDKFSLSKHTYYIDYNECIGYDYREDDLYQKFKGSDYIENAL